MLLHRRGNAQRVVLIALAAILTLGVAWYSWADYRVPTMPRTESRIASEFDELVPVVTARGGALVLVMNDGTNREGESLALGEYTLTLYDRHQFVDLGSTDAPPAAGDGRPILYYGDPLAHLDRLLTRPNACANIYYVAPPLAARFSSAAARHEATCGQQPTQLSLPE